MGAWNVIEPTDEQLEAAGYKIEPDTLSSALVLKRPGDLPHILSFEREALMAVARESFRRGLIGG